MNILRIALLSLAIVLAMPAHAEPLRVFVGIAPHAYLVEQIGGEHVAVQEIVGEGQSPHTFQIRPRQVGDLSQAAVYFRCWLEFEEGLLRRLEQNYPEIRIVALTEIEHGVIEDEHHHHAHDDPNHVHDHTCGIGGFDPHTWVHPGHLNLQAEVVRDTLSELRPEQAAAFAENYDRFRQRLADTHMALRELLEPLAGRTFYVYHPSFAYFADAYGLEQVSIEHEGKSPGARRLFTTIEAMRAHSVRTLFVQPQFSMQEARAIAEETGATIETLDPLARDVRDNLLVGGRAIHSAIGDDAG